VTPAQQKEFRRTAIDGATYLVELAAKEKHPALEDEATIAEAIFEVMALCEKLGRDPWAPPKGHGRGRPDNQKAAVLGSFTSFIFVAVTGIQAAAPGGDYDGSYGASRYTKFAQPIYDLVGPGLNRRTVRTHKKRVEKASDPSLTFDPELRKYVDMSSHQPAQSRPGITKLLRDCPTFLSLIKRHLGRNP
jgi:hypothetical protein